MTTVIGSIREYFLLSEARATAKVVPEDARVALDRQLAVGRQRSEAADALWSNGHVAEGLRLAAEAFDATVSAVAPFADAIAPPGRTEPAVEPQAAVEPEGEPAGEAAASDAQPSDAQSSEPQSSDADAGETDAEASEAASDDAEPSEPPADAEASDAAGDDAEASEESPEATASDATADTLLASEPAAPREEAGRADDRADAGEPAWASVLRRRGLSEGKTREAIEASRLRHARTLPLLDDEVTANDGELFQQLVIARRHVDRVLAPASMTPGQLQWTRVSRVGFASVLAVATAFGLYLLLRPPTGVEATASGQYSAEFSGDRAIDGDEATEWLLPDRQEGSLDVRIMPPEHIDTLRLKNSHNRHYNDRATNEYTIEVYSNGRVARTIEGSWQGIAPRPAWTEHELGVHDVERIVLRVRSWHRNGGGLAEIDWD